MSNIVGVMIEIRTHRGVEFRRARELHATKGWRVIGRSKQPAADMKPRYGSKFERASAVPKIVQTQLSPQAMEIAASRHAWYHRDKRRAENRAAMEAGL